LWIAHSWASERVCPVALKEHVVLHVHVHNFIILTNF
jgi:hypothetical protein